MSCFYNAEIIALYLSTEVFIPEPEEYVGGL
jgi:hypothetical protein